MKYSEDNLTFQQFAYVHDSPDTQNFRQLLCNDVIHQCIKGVSEENPCPTEQPDVKVTNPEEIDGQVDQGVKNSFFLAQTQVFEVAVAVP